MATDTENRKVRAEFKAAPDETGYKRVAININDENKQKELIDLAWYLGIANPVYKNQKLKIEKKVNGQTKTQEIEKAVFSHYEFPRVNGELFTDWIKTAFGENTKVDPQTKEVYTLTPDKDTPAPQPQVQSETEETQPQNNPEVNPNDPENN